MVALHTWVVMQVVPYFSAHLPVPGTICKKLTVYGTGYEKYYR
jgi:hypothetical protein